jgi:hypothetical protein
MAGDAANHGPRTTDDPTHVIHSLGKLRQLGSRFFDRDAEVE